MVKVFRRCRIIAIATEYWKPREDFMEKIVENIKPYVKNGDTVVVSEKAVSTALGNIVDEQKIKPSFNSKFLAVFWMRFIWGYFLGKVCHLKPKTIKYLRAYPRLEGSRHKQVVLQHAGWLQALMHSSESGIDGSNLPYAYVSLPLQHPEKVATEIRNQIKESLKKTVAVMIVDTDKTYSIGNLHFTPRSTSVKGVYSNGGFAFYVAGRFLRLKKRATPVAAAGFESGLEELLRFSEIANRARGSGAGRNVWEMVESFGVGFSEVTWEMLNTVKHKPIVIVKR